MSSFFRAISLCLIPPAIQNLMLSLIATIIGQRIGLYPFAALSTTFISLPPTILSPFSYLSDCPISLGFSVSSYLPRL